MCVVKVFSICVWLKVCIPIPVAVPAGSGTVPREDRGRLCGVQGSEPGCQRSVARPGHPSVLPQVPPPLSPDQHSRAARRSQQRRRPTERHPEHRAGPSRGPERPNQNHSTLQNKSPHSLSLYLSLSLTIPPTHTPPTHTTTTQPEIKTKM